jgi:hypothetical protein
MAGTSTVTFAIGGTSVTVNGPPGPTDVGALPQTTIDRAADNTLFSYRHTSTKLWVWSIGLKDLTAAQKDALEDFFLDTAIGPTNAFTYTHTDGTAYANCRFISTELRFQRVNGDVWDVPVQIQVPSQVV